MSLYIRDPDVAALAAKLQDLTGSRTRTEAVRLALQQAIERANAKRSFAQRNAYVLEMADALGSTNPSSTPKRSSIGCGATPDGSRRFRHHRDSCSRARRPTLRGCDRRRQDAAQRLALTIFEAATGLAREKLRVNRPPTPEEIVAAHAVVMAFLAANNVKEMLVGADVGWRALDAAARFGRVVGHPATLNFGDCFVYACAKAYRVPLLFKGEDFSRTDIND